MLEFDFTFFTFATGGCKKKHSHTNTTLCSPRVDQERGKHAHSNSGDIEKMRLLNFLLLPGAQPPQGLLAK